MKRVQAKGTRIELLISIALKNEGVTDFQLNRIVDEQVEGKVRKREVDFLFPEKKIALFAHGCHWHKHKNCSKSYFNRLDPDTKQKRIDTEIRDSRLLGYLHSQGWRTAIIWECGLAQVKEAKYRDVVRLRGRANHPRTIQSISDFIGWMNSEALHFETLPA